MQAQPGCRRCAWLPAAALARISSTRRALAPAERLRYSRSRATADTIRLAFFSSPARPQDCGCRVRQARKQVLEDLGGGSCRSRCLVHPHVERGVLGVGEAAVGLVELHGGDAEVEQHALDAGAPSRSSTSGSSS